MPRAKILDASNCVFSPLEAVLRLLAVLVLVFLIFDCVCFLVEVLDLDFALDFALVFVLDFALVLDLVVTLAFVLAFGLDLVLETDTVGGFLTLSALTDLARAGTSKQEANTASTNVDTKNNLFNLPPSFHRPTRLVDGFGQERFSPMQQQFTPNI